ncbi:hypothetical protein EDD11_005601 [Mortierella claussenii]|nr:hypothetical protein EDD11_005601 [Mortierella claussenii]
MAAQHSDKRIKLFLERSIDRLPFDITQKAEEIYIPDGDPTEKLKRKIMTISAIAGDKYDNFTDNIVAAAENIQEGDKQSVGLKDQEGTSGAENDGESSATATVPAAASSATARVTSPQGIYAKLWY